jgi:phosphoribosylformimino-5-aminoimidazole carboxamide ribotide isomerase
VERVVIGSITVSNRALVKSILHEFGPNRITLAIDVVRVKQEFFVAVNGWKNVTDTRAIDLVREYRELVERVLCTDIQLDGMMMGPNVQLYENFLRDFPELDFQASGGMSRLEDLDKLSAVGIRSAVVGKAIYEGTLDLCEALSRFRGGVRAY